MKRWFCLVLAVALGGILYIQPASAQHQPSAGQNNKAAPQQTTQQPASQPAPYTLPAPGEMQPVTTISFGGGEFIKAFNGSADRARLVLIFSPT